MQCSRIIRQLEQLAPKEYAYEWDNPGLLAGRLEKDVQKILVALDVTDAVVDQAIAEKADLLLTHHPLLFKALRQINDQDFISRRIVRLIQADISYYAMHTNFDAAPGCMADLAAERLKLAAEGPLEVTGEHDGQSFGIGKIGLLPEPVSLSRLAELVKEQFDLPFVTIYGMDEIQEPVQRIAVSPGSGKSMISPALQAGVQVLVTGDIGHHEGIDAVANNLAVIDAGHYGLEHIFMKFMEQYLQQQFGHKLEVITAAPAFPAQVI
ncbi:MAG: Nif3-like dinuclear metal center hexameric protein [Lachnospiraceae bacterium]